MENLWLELIKAAPNTAALLFIVVYFLRHIRDGESSRLASEERRDKAYAEVVDRATLQLEKSSEAMGRVAAITERHNRILNGTNGG